MIPNSVRSVDIFTPPASIIYPSRWEGTPGSLPNLKGIPPMPTGFCPMVRTLLGFGVLNPGIQLVFPPSASSLIKFPFNVKSQYRQVRQDYSIILVDQSDEEESPRKEEKEREE